jgi:hypothetical protein
MPSPESGSNSAAGDSNTRGSRANERSSITPISSGTASSSLSSPKFPQAGGGGRASVWRRVSSRRSSRKTRPLGSRSRASLRSSASAAGRLCSAGEGGQSVRTCAVRGLAPGRAADLTRKGRGSRQEGPGIAPGRAADLTRKGRGSHQVVWGTSRRLRRRSFHCCRFGCSLMCVREESGAARKPPAGAFAWISGYRHTTSSRRQAG